MSSPHAAPELAPCKHCGKYHPQEVLRCPTTDVLLDLRGRLLDGRFRMVKRLGVGGMAEIWLARNESVDRRLAIKILRAEVERSEENLARFQTEAKAAGRIRSRYVCEVLDFGQCAAGPYIVMQWLRGRDLAEWVEDEGRLDVGDAVWVVRRALLGLADAHASGVLHRDLKPSNIFIHQEESGELVVKLMDFGVARFIDAREGELTHAGAVLGTPEYMAPEQLVSPATVDERADIWAIGAVLYRIITGERVFSGDGLESILHAVVAQDIAPIRTLVPTVPKELAAIIDSCLARDIALRPPTATLLFEELAPFERSPSGPFRVVEPTYSIGGGVRRAPTGALALPEPAGAPAPSRTGVGLLRDVALSLTGLALLAGVWATCRGEATEPSATAIASSQEVARADAAPGSTPVVADAATIGKPQNPGSGVKNSSSRLASRTGKGGRSSHEASASGGSVSELPDVDSVAAGTPAEKKVLPTTKSVALTVAPPVKSTPEGATEERDLTRPGTVVSGEFLVLSEKSPLMSQWQAKEYCKELADAGHLGIYTWHLPNPAEIGKIAKSGGVRRGRYWSSAAWRGKAKAYFLPSGRSISLKTTRGFVRPLCIAKR